MDIGVFGYVHCCIVLASGMRFMLQASVGLIETTPTLVQDKGKSCGVNIATD